MKIGILTFHFGNNYGGILQCYALQQVLKGYGWDVEILDYRPEPVSLFRRMCRKIKSLNNLSSLADLVRDFFGTTLRSQRHGRQDSQRESLLRKFDDFRRSHLNLSRPLTADTIGTYCADLDAVVVGSDQVWTSLYEKHAIYFLDWIPAFEGRKFSYAACSAYGRVDRKRAKHLQSLLERFTAVSVRDATTATLVEQIAGYSPQIVCDPTILYDFKELSSVCREPNPYILTYILGGEISGGHAQALACLRGKYPDAKVYAIVLPGAPNEIVGYADKVFEAASPEEWIALFKNACFVYTDSFHGCMFSLKFHIPFVAYYANAVRASRLIDLRDRWHLDNIINCVSDLNRDQIRSNAVIDETNSMAFISQFSRGL